MSYLSIALTRFAEQNRLTQTDLGRISGLTRSHLSRIFSGEQKNVTDDDFLALLRPFSKPLQAELLVARCLDATACAAGTAAADLVEIKLKGERSSQDPPAENTAPQVQLSQETERAFAWLRSQCPVNPDLEKHLVGYARLTGMR